MELWWDSSSSQLNVFGPVSVRGGMRKIFWSVPLISWRTNVLTEYNTDPHLSTSLSSKTVSTWSRAEQEINPGEPWQWVCWCNPFLIKIINIVKWKQVRLLIMVHDQPRLGLNTSRVGSIFSNVRVSRTEVRSSSFQSQPFIFLPSILYIIRARPQTRIISFQ